VRRIATGIYFLRLGHSSDFHWSYRVVAFTRERDREERESPLRDGSAISATRDTGGMMKVQELSHPEISVLACYDVEEPDAVELVPTIADAPNAAPKLRSMRIICLDECAIPQ
jgi:hypothetical protein